MVCWGRGSDSKLYSPESSATRYSSTPYDLTSSSQTMKRHGVAQPVEAPRHIFSPLGLFRSFDPLLLEIRL